MIKLLDLLTDFSQDLRVVILRVIYYHFVFYLISHSTRVNVRIARSIRSASIFEMKSVQIFHLKILFRYYEDSG